MKYQYILFDLYGTLCDIMTDENMPFVWRVTADNYAKFGAVYTPEELKKSFYRTVNEQIEDKDSDFEPDLALTFKKLFSDKNVQVSDDVILQIGQEFRKSSTLFLNLYDGVIDGLKALKAEGKKLILMSNAQRIFTYPELEILNLVDLFDDIFISSDYGVKKPSLKFYDLPFKKYGINKENAIMVGNDGTCDILGAKTYGIDTMYVRTNTSPKEEYPPATYIFSSHNFKVMTKILMI